MILLVEDDTAVADLLREILAEEGYEVAWAAHGRLALPLLDAAPALIICDMMMPVMDGPAFCRAVRADPRFGGLPIVAMSAIPIPPAVGALVTAAVAKPVQIARLSALIAGLIGSSPAG